jgi:5-methyltetrahydrofolate--homocysteine methyltransferase
MTAADRLRQLLSRRIVVIDGAIGTLLSDVPDKEALAATDPARLAAIHTAYLDAGADIIKTNTFRATTYEANAAAARIARRVADDHTRGVPARRPLVAGVIGPVRGTSDTIQAVHHAQVRGLIDGGVDLLLVETIMDTSQAQAAAAAARADVDERGSRIPLMCSATLDRAGRLLSGETLETFVASVTDAQPLSIGLNCAHGARDIGPHLARLASLTDAYVSCHPSAGLPDANGHYPERPEDTASVLRELAERGLVNIVGGCCGTTPDYTGAIADAVRTVPAGAIRTARGGSRSSP